MSEHTEQLTKWWGGLGASERAQCLRAAQAGHLDEGTRRSLNNAGLVGQGTLPTDDEVITFLKMRH